MAVLTMFVATAAYAQEERANTVDEIIVTAQKREQKLQDVPIVVTSLSQQVLEGAGVRDIKDLQILTPGLTVTSTSNETVTTARIRGVGTVGDNPGLESSVGVVIDGVYRPRNGVSFGDLGPVERIEVLKGPQGTLFGKNTSAGVINILTRQPTFEPRLEAEASYGNFNAYGGSVWLSGPFSDQLAASLYVAGRQRDGFYDVVTGTGPRTLDEDQDQNFWTARGQLLWQPSSSLSLRLIGDYTDRNENCCVAVQTRTGPTAAIVDAFTPLDSGVLNPADPFRRLAFSNRDTTQDITDRGIQLQGDWDTGWANSTVTSITAFRSWDSTTAQDSDFSTADIFYRNADGSNTVGFDQFSQELRIAGTSDRFDWLFGGFYAHERLTRDDSIIFGSAYEPYWSTATLNGIAGLASRIGAAPPSVANAFNFFNEANGPALGLGQGFPAGTGYRDRYDQTSNSFALFTNDTFHVTDKFDIVAGARYTHENKEMDANYVGGAPGCGAFLTPAGQAGIAGALIARGVSPAIFAPGDPRGPALVSTTVALACLTGSNPLFNGLNTHQEISQDELTGTVKLIYNWTDDLMTYASFARGYKAGGFNLDRAQSSNGLPTGGTGVIPVADTSFPAEFVDSYEVGFKSTLAGGSVLLNATAFYQKFTDFQLNTFLGTTFAVESIPEVTTAGVDADLIWFTPVEGLNFQGGLTYANTKYNDFTAADLANPGRFPPLSLLPGNHVSFAPEWSLSGAVDYSHDINDSLRVLFNASVKYVTDYNTGSDLSPFKKQDGYALVNGRIGIGSADERWTLEFWGQNIFNQDYYQVVFNAPLQGSLIPLGVNSYNVAADTNTYNAFLGQPRTFGATLRVKWGGGK
jgi:outer membrane receptor protein involved in Fe transport